MIHFATLYSGSSGNSTAVWDENTTLLIDMGASCKKTLFAMGELGLSAKSVSAILVTHEHSDHIGGIQVFAKHYPVPIFGTQETGEYLFNRAILSDLNDFHRVVPGTAFQIGSFSVIPFATSHDSKTCCGFRIEKGNGHLAVATDLGKVDDRILSYLSGCQLVALESNYDEMM
ncbi:MAG: MBL fold metallo-hydrolase, partial [Oscillospiraceae bacterium]|nr:MBL fold metallo-hydrolase [Oscillospiraceae bacterium]